MRPEISEIQRIVKSLYEQGATQRGLKRYIGICPDTVSGWAQQYGWQTGARRLFRCNDNRQSDALEETANHTPGQMVRKNCTTLFRSGMSIDEIYRETGIEMQVLSRWLNPDPEKKTKLSRRTRLIDLTETELELVMATPNKSADDYKRIAQLTDTLKALQRGATAPEEKPEKGTKGKKAKTDDETPLVKKQERRRANDISHVTDDLLDEIRDDMLFLYQKTWHQNKHRRNRFILKSRQIGATFYFAWEALDDAIRTGDNQIFISASRDQAEVFKRYMAAFAQKYFEVELKGKFCCVLSNGAELRFLATNSSTAQSYHGHLYIDEVFWIPKFKTLKRVADGMAAHKKWRKTYFSTPSAMSHEAYPLWTGADFANNHKISDFEIDTSHEALKDGLLGPDGIWRHMVTVEDAEAQGCNLFDIAELKLDYSENDFANQFMCKFIDDSQSVFSLGALMTCVVEQDDWPDYKPNMERPFAHRSVSFGYDPSRTRDNASMAILSMPDNVLHPFRVLHLHNLHGQNVQSQARFIEGLKERHTVRHLGIDTTGIGSGVYDLVRDFYPQATAIHYSPAMKNNLVIKMQDLIANGRFKYLSSQHEITRAFMMITQTTTPTGQIVYASSRSPTAGHADIAWAIMHAVIAEEINVNRKPTQVTFSD